MSDFCFPQVPSLGESLDWDVLDAAFYWVRAMRAVPQDPLYHAEGDVWIHTRMVLAAVLGLEAWPGLMEPERSLLFWGALLHDVAKPMCTRVEPEGRITSRNHARKGEQVARELMWNGVPEPVPFLLREHIAKLVRLHGLPLWMVDKPDPRRAVLEASQHVDVRLLALLAEADVRGRTCADQEDLLERIALFRAYAQELGCYDKPYPFATALSRFTYFRKDNSPPDYIPFDETWGEVTIMAGLPGAGKDTWIQKHALAQPVIALDAIRAELGIDPRDKQGRVIQTARERARVFLRKQQPFIWNATNITRRLRKPLIDMMVDYGARVRLVYVEPAYRILFQQNRSRKAVVPEAVIHAMIRRLEVPAITEAHEVVYAVEGSR